MRNDIDDAIVRLLVQDTRATHRRIAESIGIPESTARARVQGIIESGKVVPSILVHPDIEGDSFIFMVRMQLAEGFAASHVSEDDLLASSPWIAQVSTSGELIVQLSAAGLDRMIGALDTLRSLRGVRLLQSLIVLRVFVGANWQANIADSGRWAAQPTRGVDAIDRSLMGALQKDGRASYTALASIVGLTVAATRRRVLRLAEDGVIRFATRVQDDSSPSAEAAIDLLVGAADTEQLINDLCGMTSVRYVIEQTGIHNLACYVVADSTADLARAVDVIVRDTRVIEARPEPLLIQRDRISWTDSSFR